MFAVLVCTRGCQYGTGVQSEVCVSWTCCSRARTPSAGTPCSFRHAGARKKPADICSKCSKNGGVASARLHWFHSFLLMCQRHPCFQTDPVNACDEVGADQEDAKRFESDGLRPTGSSNLVPRTHGQGQALRSISGSLTPRDFTTAAGGNDFSRKVRELM